MCLAKITMQYIFAACCGRDKGSASGCVHSCTRLPECKVRQRLGQTTRLLLLWKEDL